MKKHIILIDPEKTNLNLFMQAFDEVDIDIKCTYTESCNHAAEMLKYIQPDAVFVQLDPGITDALEFVRTLKWTRRFKSIPTIVYSDHMAYYNFLARGHGADHCMTGPLLTSHIKAALEQFLRNLTPVRNSHF